MILFLSLGPLFGNPRIVVVFYELGLLPFIGGASTVSLALFSLGFAAVALYLALPPGQIVDIVGKLMTPVLIASLVSLGIDAFMFSHG